MSRDLRAIIVSAILLGAMAFGVACSAEGATHGVLAPVGSP